MLRCARSRQRRTHRTGSLNSTCPDSPPTTTHNAQKIKPCCHRRSFPKYPMTSAMTLLGLAETLCKPFSSFADIHTPTSTPKLPMTPTSTAPTSPRPPIPPFTRETAAQKVRLAEDAWNTRESQHVALAYTVDAVWHNRAEVPVGRARVQDFLERKWARELAL